MSLSVGVAKIFATDVSNLSKKLRASQKRGVRFQSSLLPPHGALIVAAEIVCSECKDTISVDCKNLTLSRNSHPAFDLILTGCSGR
jgi:hypothetical protein